MTSLRRSTILAVLALWTLLGVLSAGQLYLLAHNEGESVSFAAALGIQLPAWLLWAAVTPLVLWLGRRFRFTGSGLPGALAVHLGTALAISAVRSLVLSWTNLELFRSPGPTPTFANMLVGQLYSRSLFDVMTYAGILGVGYAVDYRDRLSAREVDAARLETELAHAELHALKMQLHPHFLFNTLNAIGVLTEEDPAAAREMIGLLGDLLRAALDQSGAQEVRLRQELEFLTSYLAIERRRFAARLTAEVDVPAGLLDAWVPNLVLQPLVENAVRYAIAPRAAPGTITIRAERHDGALSLIVTDDGPGFAAQGSAGGRGVGLATTRARLRRLYGEQGRLELARGAEGGAVVTVTVPFRAGAAPR